MFSLSAVSSVVNVVVAWPTDAPSGYPEWIRTTYTFTINYVKQHPTWTTILVYSAVVALTIITLWYGSVESWGQRRRVLEDRRFPRTKEGTVAPVPFTIIGVDHPSEALAKERSVNNNDPGDYPHLCASVKAPPPCGKKNV